MRTLSLGSCRARLSSSSTTSQFRSPHLGERGRAEPRSQLGAPPAEGAGLTQPPPELLNRHGSPSQCSWGAPSSGTYSLRNCCASSLLRNTLGPWVSAATRLTSRRQSPGPSASTLHGDSGNRAQRGRTPRETAQQHQQGTVQRTEPPRKGSGEEEPPRTPFSHLSATFARSLLAPEWLSLPDLL